MIWLTTKCLRWLVLKTIDAERNRGKVQIMVPSLGIQHNFIDFLEQLFPVNPIAKVNVCLGPIITNIKFAPVQ